MAYTGTNFPLEKEAPTIYQHENDTQK